MQALPFSFNYNIHNPSYSLIYPTKKLQILTGCESHFWKGTFVAVAIIHRIIKHISKKHVINNK